MAPAGCGHGLLPPGGNPRRRRRDTAGHRGDQLRAHRQPRPARAAGPGGDGERLALLRPLGRAGERR
ncbi:hypothetical protein CWI85_21380, partial [Streptomyces albidoflavus]